jgi:hypothetical protein
MAAVKEPQKVQTVKEIEQEMLGPKKSAPSDNENEEVLLKEKKPLGKPGVALLISLAWLTVFSLFILFVLNDPTPDKSVRGWLLLRLNPESLTREEVYMSEILGLQDDQRDLELEWEELDSEREALLLFEEALDDREMELDDWEMALEYRRDSMAGGVGGGIVSPDILHAVKTVERMEPAVAALALEDMLFDTALRICSMISPKRLAPIANAMEPDFLVRILEEMSEPLDDDWDDWDDWNDW